MASIQRVELSENEKEDLEREDSSLDINDFF